MVLEKRVQYKQNKKMDKTDFNETEKKQCLGCGSVGSARFWLPSRILGAKYQPKTVKQI